jgi:hypothetical protein
MAPRWTRIVPGGNRGVHVTGRTIGDRAQRPCISPRDTRTDRLFGAEGRTKWGRSPFSSRVSEATCVGKTKWSGTANAVRVHTCPLGTKLLVAVGPPVAIGRHRRGRHRAAGLGRGQKEQHDRDGAACMDHRRSLSGCARRGGPPRSGKPPPFGDTCVTLCVAARFATTGTAEGGGNPPLPHCRLRGRKASARATASRLGATARAHCRRCAPRRCCRGCRPARRARAPWGTCRRPRSRRPLQSPCSARRRRAGRSSRSRSWFGT